jgi:hypothetical protein
VIVNYGTQPYAIGSAQVPGQDFVVFQGE